MCACLRMRAGCCLTSPTLRECVGQVLAAVHSGSLPNNAETGEPPKEFVDAEAALNDAIEPPALQAIYTCPRPPAPPDGRGGGG